MITSSVFFTEGRMTWTHLLVVVDVLEASIAIMAIPIAAMVHVLHMVICDVFVVECLLADIALPMA
jgi:hypothetical protein